MPTSRRSTGATRGRTGPARGQSTISFASKVTKSVPKDVKNNLVKSTATKIDVPERTKPVQKQVEKAVEDDADEREEEEQEDPEPREEVPDKTEAELKAEKLTDSHIDKYWKDIEKERKAPRVHQEGLSVNDKILRYFDVSSQYGPCIGIDRMKRWRRAERLGLRPPIEVLSVLLKEQNKSNKEAETAQMDHILNSIAVGS
ncbi:DNA polymerase delta subunit 4 [Metarhizium album ARSEF 1941]|uniref:DNA polymerase delta subunit 4 n=1 Tax=Metarhizium album (strain ARSEF 1941) TaxID=1081103 RepID=A0A0B2X012_METAS|nr:DNA polymerase delta subunit 4 [Metarhizium album ARSEF 1941]KHO01852.1 DNA polymerase delta subunit 4 [Metarhizium album ARSEF 1941]